MTDFFERISQLSPKRLALLALEMHEKLEAAGEHSREPIAVIGMGCRFPGGANNPSEYWTLLAEGRDAIRDIPADRWDKDAYFDADPDVPARMSVRNGGFLDDVSGFDPSFFGISPREALTMDPQQRLLLEVSWEALEHAGMSPERLAGTPTGVFFGLCNSDHFQRALDRGMDAIDAYVASGSAHSVASGRVSYFLGLQGPAISIDTACSSSLVALHVACQSVRNGESRTALAGGVNLMCAPETTIALTKAHMLAPDGRCKTFDAAADGFARGEGCGVVVLKRLSHAREDGDRVLAVIRGSAVNQDGRSGGLTVPNGPAQEAVIRAALSDAGLSPADISYVEAHGTGTSLGDPIEVRALAGALGPGRSAENPLRIGSVKTNLGHLESAAGVAGVIKVILSLQHERIPRHLHFREPSPHIAWSQYPVRVTDQGEAWPRNSTPRRAGVSSFGFSGTNAHVVIEEAPEAAAHIGAPLPQRPVHTLALSARSPEALRTLASDFSSTLERGTASLADVAHTAGVGRSHFAERLSVVAADVADARGALNAFARGEPHAALHRGTAVPGVSPDVVFVFTGQGSQYPGMGRDLYETAPLFREIIDRCDALLGADANGQTLKSVLLPGPTEGALIHETAWTQPALFAVEYALAQLWRSWGIEPAAVIGHSVGEYVAACVAGVFTMEEGLQLIAERGRLMQALPPGGAMAALFAPAEDIEAAIAGYGAELAIAAYNAPDSVVISGGERAIDRVLAELAKQNVQGHKLFVQLAGHSPLVAPALDAMETCARKVNMSAPRIPVAWNVTGGEALPGGAPDAIYWRRHLREPVRFSQGLQTLHAQGYRVFLEVGPHPVLIALAQRTLPADDLRALTSLRRGKDDWRELMTSLAQLYAIGAPVDWTGVDRPYALRRVDLPTYPFERRPFWIAPAAPGSQRTQLNARAHTWPGQRLSTAVPIFETLLSPATTPYLAEHLVHGVVLVPGPVYLELAQAAAKQAFGSGLRAISSFSIREPLVLPETGRVVQTHVREEGAGILAFSVFSNSGEGDDQWRLHATGELVDSTARQAVAGADITSFTATRDALGAATSCQGYYDQLAALGIHLGPGFQSLQEAHRRDGESLALVQLPEASTADAVTWAHPVLLDGVLQAVGLTVPPMPEDGDAYLLTGVERIELAGPLPHALWCHARLLNPQEVNPAERTADVTLRSLEGGVLGVVRGVQLRRASRDALRRAAGGASGADLFHEVSWEPAPVAQRAAGRLRSPGAIAGHVRERFATLADQHGLSVYDRLLPELDQLSIDYVVKALRSLGFDETPGRRFTEADEARRLGVVAAHGRLFGRLLEMLVEDGILRRQESTFEVCAPLRDGDTEARHVAAAKLFGAVDGELNTLQRCGPRLADVLRGEQDPLQLLFPGGSFGEARKLYVESPYAQTYNRALGEALRAAISALPAGTPLRVLEIGAGTGGTTHYVLPLLPPERTEYTFTDLSPLFLERAAEQFAQYSFVRRALLDIERDPVEQGFQENSFDVVIAANVLHATADLQDTLENVKRLMAPEAMLILLEGVGPERWVDLTFGMTDGWWRFTDSTLRPAYPLVSRATWATALQQLGFEDIVSLPDDSWTTRAGLQQALMLARTPKGGRRWTILGDARGLGVNLAEELRTRGDAVQLLPTDSTNVSGDVIYLGGLELARDGSGDNDTTQQRVTLTEELPRLLLANAAARGDGRVWLVTQGVHSVAGERRAAGATLQAPLWGWGRGFALEHPAQWGGLIDLPLSEDPSASAKVLLAALDGNDGEDQVAWRDGQRYVARLRQITAPESGSVRFHADACYMVTGGFGGLGLVVAQWMAEQGAGHIALLGRHPDPDSDGVRAIEAAGAIVHVLQGDVSNEVEMTAAFAKLAAQAPPLRGIMHAAAALSHAPVAALTTDQVRAMMSPKIDGTLVLERLTQSMALDFVVLFSSTTALLGASGLAHYAAANAFLDTLAQSSEPDRHIISINWGTWEVMRLATSADQRYFREGGLLPMPAANALDALGRLLNNPRASTVVAQVDWDVLKSLHEVRRPRPFLTHLGGKPQQREMTRKVEQGPSLAERLGTVPSAMRHDLLVEFVQAEVAAVLSLGSPSSVPLSTGLFDLGMDSLMAVELKRRLERGAARPMPSTLTFNYPNVAALARFLETQLIAKAVAPSSDTLAAPQLHDVPDPDVDLDELTDDELEARLMARLDQTR